MTHASLRTRRIPIWQDRWVGTSKAATSGLGLGVFTKRTGKSTMWNRSINCSWSNMIHFQELSWNYRRVNSEKSKMEKSSQQKAEDSRPQVIPKWFGPHGVPKRYVAAYSSHSGWMFFKAVLARSESVYFATFAGCRSVLASHLSHHVAPLHPSWFHWWNPPWFDAYSGRLALRI